MFSGPYDACSPLMVKHQLQEKAKQNNSYSLFQNLVSLNSQWVGLTLLVYRAAIVPGDSKSIVKSGDGSGMETDQEEQ